MRRAPAFVAFALLCAPASAGAATSDPYRSLQWGLKKIHAEVAWTASRGAGSVIAVIDTGVDLAHPDLQGKLLPGRDVVDDDDDPTDENGHGTLIAGIIAARTSNGIGIAAAAPAARLIPVRALDEDGMGNTQDVVEAVNWSVEQGADVINLSLAQESGTLLSDRSVDAAIQLAAAKGATVVVAAGNDHDGGNDSTAYDATTPGVVVIGASTKDDRLAAYSNYGPGLDLLAPGGGSATEASMREGCTNDNAIVSTWWDPDERESTYGAGCGSSMAVAFVSGVAALLHAERLTNDEIVDRLKVTAFDLGADGRDDVTGYGRLDAARALGVPIPKPKPKAVSTIKTGSGGVRTSGSVTGASPRPSPLQGRPRVVPPAPGIVLPQSLPVDAHRGWPVSVAALLASIVAVAHLWRLAFRSPRT